MIFQENEISLLFSKVDTYRKNGKKIIWTNGCFDILHPGHIETFKRAKELGDILIVGMNGKDSPYWATKPGRPINDENFRAIMLDSLKFIDYVYIFNDENPVKPVSILKPDIVLKGGDYIQESIKDKVFEENNLFDLTEAYKFILNSGDNKFFQEKGFMAEGLENVKNGGKIFIVNTFGNFSTTSIIDKIKK